jgi:hypothetical protein
MVVEPGEDGGERCGSVGRVNDHCQCLIFRRACLASLRGDWCPCGAQIIPRIVAPLQSSLWTGNSAESQVPVARPTCGCTLARPAAHGLEFLHSPILAYPLPIVLYLGHLVAATEACSCGCSCLRRRRTREHTSCRSSDARAWGTAGDHCSLPSRRCFAAASPTDPQRWAQIRCFARSAQFALARMPTPWAPAAALHWPATSWRPLPCLALHLPETRCRRLISLPRRALAAAAAALGCQRPGHPRAVRPHHRRLVPRLHGPAGAARPAGCRPGAGAPLPKRLQRRGQLQPAAGPV